MSTTSYRAAGAFTLCIRQISLVNQALGSANKIRLASHGYSYTNSNSPTATRRRDGPRPAGRRATRAPADRRRRSPPGCGVGSTVVRPAPLCPRLRIRRTPTRPAAPPAPPSGSAITPPGRGGSADRSPRVRAPTQLREARRRAALRPRERRSGLGHHLRALGRRYSEAVPRRYRRCRLTRRSFCVPLASSPRRRCR